MRALTALVFTLVAANAAAQATDEQQVLLVVSRVFDGMRAADSTMVRATFAEGARFASVDSRATPPKMKYDAVDGWLGGIARSANRWDEQICDVRTRVDGGIITQLSDSRRRDSCPDPLARR